MIYFSHHCVRVDVRARVCAVALPPRCGTRHPETSVRQALR